MALSQKAKEEKPKRPLSAYFRFRGKKLKEYGDDVENKVKQLKHDWENISEK